MSGIFKCGLHGNLFADHRRVIIEPSRGVGKRLKWQDEGCRTDLKKNMCEVFSTVLYM